MLGPAIDMEHAWTAGGDAQELIVYDAWQSFKGRKEQEQRAKARTVGNGYVGKGEPHDKNRDLRRPAAPHAHPPYIEYGCGQ